MARKFSKKSLETILAANMAVIKYKRLGKLTLMQLYQIIVGQGKIENSRQSYKRLQDVLSEASKHGLFNKAHIAGRYHGVDDETLFGQ